MSSLTHSRNIPMDALRAKVAAIQASGCKEGMHTLLFGIREMDTKLAGDGLSIAALHELTGASNSLNDDAAASLFAAGIVARRSMESGKVLWALTRPDLFAPALAQAGLSPSKLIYVECGRDEDVLAVMEEGLRHGGLSAVVGELDQATMAATRRLQLAAEDHGSMALMLRRWRRVGDDPLAALSAAATRWRIGCAPSRELPVQGIARPRWRIELVRQRGGEPHQWIMEGTDEAGRLALPAGPSYRSAAADRGKRAARYAA